MDRREDGCLLTQGESTSTVSQAIGWIQEPIQIIGTENVHGEGIPNATKITRHAKNACGVDDNRTTKVAAVKRIRFA